MRGVADSGSAMRESWVSSEQRWGARRGASREGEEGGSERTCARRGDEEGSGEVNMRVMRS